MDFIKSILEKIAKLNTNLLVAGTALVISASALYISVQEVRIMRSQQKANMYPHLTVGKVYNSRGFGVKLKNSGNGLAKINSYQIYDDSIYYRDWSDVIQTLVPEADKINYNVFGTAGNIRDKVVTPNEEVELIFFQWTNETKLLERHMHLLNIQLCYSSLLDDHWLLNGTSPTQIDEPCDIDMAREFYGS